MPATQRMRVVAALTALGLALAAQSAGAAERHFSFGYDQPHTTAYGFAADTFAAKLKELSNGAMIIDQFPGGQLGQEPQMLQKIRTGDIDFILSATANAATVSPEAGVFSIHFIFRDEDHLKKAISDPKVVAAFRKMINDTVQGSQVLTLLTLGLRDFYSKKEIHNIGDLKGLKIRVQATPTEDTFFTRLRRPGRPHAVRRGLHVAADRGRRRGRERHQRLPVEQALRSGAGDVVVRARG